MKQSLQSKEHGTHPGILAVAERLFAEIGFEKTTVADIARELRMSPANVYRFFSAKAEINEAVGRRLLRAVEAAGEEIVRQPQPAGEKLRAFLAAVENANTIGFAPIASCMICSRRRSAKTGRSRMTTSKN